MKKEINYASPRAAMELVSRGIRWKASAYWFYLPNKGYFLKEKLEPFRKGWPAYTTAELGHMIPFGFFNNSRIMKLLNNYYTVELADGKLLTFQTEAEARAFYLVHLIDSKQVTIHDVENPEKRAVISKDVPVPTVYK